MKRNFRINTSDTIDDFETRLHSVLRPVAADSEFVGKLQKRLVTPSTAVLERQSQAVGLIVLAAGLSAGVIILVLLERIVRILFPKRYRIAG
jgi:hypothetical protein